MRKLPGRPHYIDKGCNILLAQARQHDLLELPLNLHPAARGGALRLELASFAAGALGLHGDRLPRCLYLHHALG